MIKMVNIDFSVANKRFCLISIVLTFCFAVFFAYLEYYYILLDGFPYRIASEPILFVFHSYHIFPVVPILALIAFLPSLHQYLFKLTSAKNGLYVLGLVNLVQGLTTLDFLWFVFRALAPDPRDPFAGIWIRAGDWTSLSIGYIDLFGFLFPAWYLITIPLIIPFYIAFMISR